MFIVDMILKIKQNQIARATHHNERWYIINTSDGIRQCDLNGENIKGFVELRQKDILAYYDFPDE